MALGPGRYDDLCTLVRERAEAEGALLVILDGQRGHGFSCQASWEATLALPDILEDVIAKLREAPPEPPTEAAGVLALSKRLQRLLAGKPPEFQGAVLADLLSLFIAGHHPALREEILQIHNAKVRELIAPSEQQIFEQRGGKPEGWETQ